jgi:hypothetical protein
MVGKQAELRQYWEDNSRYRFNQFISDANKRAVDGIRRIFRGEMKPSSGL